MSKSQNLIKTIEALDVGAMQGIMGAEDLPPGYSVKFIGQEGWELRCFRTSPEELIGRFPTEREAVVKACELEKEKESEWEE